MPKISVIIPAYNSAKFIGETIESAKALDHDDLEIIVVNDGSSDNTSKIVSRMEQVKLIDQPNAGDSAARQTGLGQSSGEFIIFLDHDDLLLPGAATAHLEAFNQSQTFDLVYGANFQINAQGKITGENRERPRPFTAKDVLFGTTPSFSQCMYRRSALEQVGGLRAEALAAADHDLNLRLLGWEERGFIHDTFVMKYRLHEGQQTKSPARLFAMHTDVLKSLLGPGGEIENPELLTQALGHWKRFYGQYLPSEIMRMLLKGDFQRFINSTRLFATISPYAVPSALDYWVRRLGKKVFVSKRNSESLTQA